MTFNYLLAISRLMQCTNWRTLFCFLSRKAYAPLVTLLKSNPNIIKVSQVFSKSFFKIIFVEIISFILAISMNKLVWTSIFHVITLAFLIKAWTVLPAYEIQKSYESAYCCRILRGAYVVLLIKVWTNFFKFFVFVNNVS